MSKETMSTEEVAAVIDLIKSGEAAKAVDAADAARQPVIAELDDKLEILRRQRESEKLKGDISRALESEDFTEVARLAMEAQKKGEDQYAKDHVDDIAEGKKFTENAAREIIQIWIGSKDYYDTKIVSGMKKRSFYKTSGLHPDFFKPLEGLMGIFGPHISSLKFDTLTDTSSEIEQIKNNAYFREIFGKAIEAELSNLLVEGETPANEYKYQEELEKLKKLKKLIV